MERWIIDRIEGDVARCEREDATFIDLDLALLPQEAKEGDCLFRLPDGGYAVDEGETQARRAKAAERLRRLFQKERS